MAIKKYVAISYCFIFLFIYLSNIAYALLSTSINKFSEEEIIPQTVAMNATVSAFSSFSSWSGTIVIVGIIALILSIVSIIIGSKSMASAV